MHVHAQRHTHTLIRSVSLMNKTLGLLGSLQRFSSSLSLSFSFSLLNSNSNTVHWPGKQNMHISLSLSLFVSLCSTASGTWCPPVSLYNSLLISLTHSVPSLPLSFAPSLNRWLTHSFTHLLIPLSTHSPKSSGATHSLDSPRCASLFPVT